MALLRGLAGEARKKFNVKCHNEKEAFLSSEEKSIGMVTAEAEIEGRSVDDELRSLIGGIEVPRD